MSLIFIVAKLWGVIHWGWLAVTAPVWGLVVLSIFWLTIQQTRKNRMRSALPDNLKWITDFLRQYHEAAKKEREHTIN